MKMLSIQLFLVGFFNVEKLYLGLSVQSKTKALNKMLFNEAKLPCSESYSVMYKCIQTTELQISSLAFEKSV